MRERKTCVDGALLDMAVNPLLLTMIATVHLYYGTLPGARVTLYKAVCDVFLNRRSHLAQELRAEQRQLVLQAPGTAGTAAERGAENYQRSSAASE